MAAGCPGDGVAGEEGCGGGVVVAGSEVVEAGFGVLLLAGVEEGGVGSRTEGWFGGAVGVVGVPAAPVAVVVRRVEPIWSWWR